MHKWTAQQWYPNLMRKVNHNHTTITSRPNSTTGSRKTTSATPRDAHTATGNDPEKLHLLNQRCTYNES